MPELDQPYIVVDFDIDHELVFLTVRNTSIYAAVNLQIRPLTPIPGLNGTRDIGTLTIFKRITYFAPGKELRLFVDSYDSFFHHLKKTQIAFDILYEDEAGKSYRQRIVHDLAIYKDFIFFIKKT